MKKGERAKGRRISEVYGETALQRLRNRLGCTFADMHCRTLDDMTKTEIRAIEIEYGVSVIRPTV